jgi:hypothetical protein
MAPASQGAECEVCHRKIAEDDLQYELVTDGHSTRLDARCYRGLVDEQT